MIVNFIIAFTLLTEEVLSSQQDVFFQREDLTCKGEDRHICLPRDYNKFDLPSAGINVIDIGIDITDVLSIHDKEYSVEFSCYFNVMWTEPRLQIPQSLLKSLNMTDSNAMFPVNLELVKQLWLPNIYIYNLRTFKVVEVLSKHAGLWITKNKEVMYSQATHINFICPMRFDNFPLDQQTCKFQVGSYSYELSKMVFTQTSKVQGYVKTANSVVLDYGVTIQALTHSDMVLDYGNLGNFSVAGFEMNLQRHVSHYLITYYLPSGLFVVVSWISFVVPPDVIPGRMALLITLFLVLVNIFDTVTSNTPKAEGLTAIEAWMLSCILFVFGALVEYAVILFQSQSPPKPLPPPRQHSNRTSRIICRENFKYEITSENGAHCSNMLELEETKAPLCGDRSMLCGPRYINADRFFLVAMPILFLVFNVSYWISYGGHLMLALEEAIPI